jgi:hypothetical protein
MGRPVALTMRRVAACLLAVLLALPPASAADATPAPTMAGLAGLAGCRFVPPAGWAAAGTRWMGGCAGGLAQGRGLLRDYRGGRVLRSFYGTLAAGVPVRGVIDLGDGYQAGTFQGDKLVTATDRAQLIQAFDEAAAAARQVAESYRKARNTGSARYYQDKAKQLAEQID